jgi:hypothetical protein
MKPFQFLLPLLPLLVQGAIQSGFLRKHSRSITILGKDNLTSEKRKTPMGRAREGSGKPTKLAEAKCDQNRRFKANTQYPRC